VVCHALSVFLAASVYRVRTYHSAETILDEAVCTMEGIFLLDIRMAEMSGLELQAELTNRGNSLPSVFITGHGYVRMSVKVIKNGATDFLKSRSVMKFCSRVSAKPSYMPMKGKSAANQGSVLPPCRSMNGMSCSILLPACRKRILRHCRVKANGQFKPIASAL